MKREIPKCEICNYVLRLDMFGYFCLFHGTKNIGKFAMTKNAKKKHKWNPLKEDSLCKMGNKTYSYTCTEDWSKVTCEKCIFNRYKEREESLKITLLELRNCMTKITYEIMSKPDVQELNRIRCRHNELMWELETHLLFTKTMEGK